MFHVKQLCIAVACTRPYGDGGVLRPLPHQKRHRGLLWEPTLTCWVEEGVFHVKRPRSRPHFWIASATGEELAA
ncbi:hypothetical protein ASF30_19190 [Leifsonia sp. Leaf264]|nr:hypothetical protein ASF30_19190 [Leifsonia sp. Leaf264]